MTLELPNITRPVALDTETSGLHPDDGATVACVALASEDWSVALPFDQGVRDKFHVQQLTLDFSGKLVDPNLPREDWEYLLRWLSDKDLIFQNAKFDLMMMRRGTRHFDGVDLVDQLYWDTMLVSGVISPTLPRGLDAQSERYGLGGKVGVDRFKDWLKRHKFKPNRYDLVPWELMHEYVTGDAEQTYAIWKEQISLLDAMKATDDYARLMQEIDKDLLLTKALYRMEQRGIMYDDGTSMREAEKLESMAEEIEARLPFKPTTHGAKGYFIGQLGLVADRYSEKTGEPSIDEEQVRKWIANDVPWAAEYAQASKYRRAVSMWYQGYPEKISMVDQRLRCVFRQGHVRSGRMSVERVQLQAIPKKDKNIPGIIGVREMLTCPDGYGLWNLDLSQAELRVATHYARCEQMAKQLAAGEDIHSNNTIDILKVTEDSPEWKEKRDIAKRLTFGGIFQIGGETFQKTLSRLADIHLPLDECWRMIQGWRNKYPEFGYAYRKADQKATTDGYVRLCPNSPYEIRSYFAPTDYTNTAWNRMVQGSLAEVFGIWLGETERRWPGFMILTVHDSILLECPLDEGDEIARQVAEYGAELFTEAFQTPMRVDIDRWETAVPQTA
jgi:DNA polymerase I-like protein with 3'-5' exonuclease and polymerase domains